MTTTVHRHRMRDWLIVIGLAVCCACGSSPRESSARVVAPAGHLAQTALSQGCLLASRGEAGHDLALRVRTVPAVSEGRQWRQFTVHVPTGYRPSVPVPLVLYFHGAGGSAAGASAGSGWSALAERDRFLVVYPQGLPFGSGGPAAWASAGPVDYGLDDLAFVRSVVTQLQRRFCVRQGAVFATGMSSGGGMAGYLACNLASQIAAIAPVAGNHYNLTMLGCHPSRAVALLEVHGTADPVVPYQGVPASLNPQWPLPSIPDWVAAWGRLDHCPGQPRSSTIADHQALVTYSHCQDGTTVELYRLDGGSHAWPATLGGEPADDVIYRFFLAHRRG